MAQHGGFGATITFATGGFEANVKLRDSSVSMTRSDIDVTHQASPSITTGSQKQGFREFKPGMGDVGTSAFDVLLDTALFVNPLLDANGTITLQFPHSDAATTQPGAKWECDGYCNSYSFDVPMDNEPIGGSLGVKWSGVPTLTNEVAA